MVKIWSWNWCSQDSVLYYFIYIMWGLPCAQYIYSKALVALIMISNFPPHVSPGHAALPSQIQGANDEVAEQVKGWYEQMETGCLHYLPIWAQPSSPPHPQSSNTTPVK